MHVYLIIEKIYNLEEYMIAKTFRKLADASPNLSLRLWQIFYNSLAFLFNKFSQLKFMNYGFSEIDNIDIKDFGILSQNLYHHLFSQIDIKGKEILEVGCGRGGGCEMALKFHPKNIIGVDFSPNLIRFCNNNYKQENLSFIKGNAEELPFPIDSFDVVINVESSHCYGNRANFFSEVNRVLRPGGYFLYADFMGRVHYYKRPLQLQNAGLSVISEQDITPNVIHSMELSADYKREMIRNKVFKPFRNAINDFVGIPGSNIFNKFKERETIYFAIVCKKL